MITILATIVLCHGTFNADLSICTPVTVQQVAPGDYTPWLPMGMLGRAAGVTP